MTETGELVTDHATATIPHKSPETEISPRHNSEAGEVLSDKDRQDRIIVLASVLKNVKLGESEMSELIDQQLDAMPVLTQEDRDEFLVSLANGEITDEMLNTAVRHMPSRRQEAIKAGDSEFAQLSKDIATEINGFSKGHEKGSREAKLESTMNYIVNALGNKNTQFGRVREDSVAHIMQENVFAYPDELDAFKPKFYERSSEQPLFTREEYDDAFTELGHILYGEQQNYADQIVDLKKDAIKMANEKPIVKG